VLAWKGCSVPRIRTVKPEFFLHEGLAAMDPLARLLFIGMWTIADKAGRLRDKPKRIKVQVLPYDDCDIDELLFALADAGHIERYEVDGEDYIQICGWSKHQNVSKSREAASKIPDPTGDLSPEDTYTARDERVQDECHTSEAHESGTQGKGIGIGKGIKNPPTPQTGGGVRDRLTDEEYDDLVGLYGKRATDDLLHQIDMHMRSKGTRYRSIHATVISWAERKGVPSAAPPKTACTNPDCCNGYVLPPGKDEAEPCPECSSKTRDKEGTTCSKS